MTTPFGRLNPADVDYQLQRLTGAQAVTAFRVQRTEADSHTSGGGGVLVGADIVEIDPTNPHLYIYTTSRGSAGDHTFDIPVSTLMQPDSTNPRLMFFPTISG